MAEKVFLVSGNFNVLHRGNMRLLRFARDCGDRLLVGVFSDRIAGKGAHIPEMLRLESVKANSWVNEAFLIDEPIEGVIARLRPDIVVKGKEHEHEFNPESQALEKFGGRLLFGSGETVFTSVDLLRKEFLEANVRSISLPDDYMRRHGIDKSRMRALLQGFPAIKVCVVGDLIIDEYVT